MRQKLTVLLEIYSNLWPFTLSPLSCLLLSYQNKGRNCPPKKNHLDDQLNLSVGKCRPCLVEQIFKKALFSDVLPKGNIWILRIFIRECCKQKAIFQLQVTQTESFTENILTICQQTSYLLFFLARALQQLSEK